MEFLEAGLCKFDLELNNITFVTTIDFVLYIYNFSSLQGYKIKSVLFVLVKNCMFGRRLIPFLSKSECVSPIERPCISLNLDVVDNATKTQFSK